jgi:hypothetical protein
MELHAKFEALVGEWFELKNKIEAMRLEAAPLVALEKDLRQKIVEVAFTTEGLREGTHSKEMPAGWKLKGTLGLDRKVDPKTAEAIEKALGDASPFRWKPEVDLKAYRGLTSEQQKIADTCITIKPSMPTLELLPPEDK